MKFPGFVLTENGEALLAKVQAGDTLTFTKAATGAGQMPPDNAPFTATASDDTVTAVRTETGSAGASDVDTGFTVTTEVAGDDTTKEETAIQCLAASELSGGERFHISTPYIDFYVWFTVDGSGADPAVSDRVGIKVALDGLDSAASVAQKLAEAMDHFRLDLANLYALIDQRQDLSINTVERVDDVVTEISTVLSNEGLSTGYYLAELGIFADDPDLGEILYSITNAGEQGDYFPAEGGATLIETDLIMRTTISADANLSMTVDSDAYASLKQVVEDQQQRAQKEPVRAATDGDITLSNLQTVDGVSLAGGDRVLVKDQATPEDNGIYVVADAAWTRAEDADEAAKLPPGMLVPVSEGTKNADSVWQLATDADITLGTTGLSFVPVGKYFIDESDQTKYQLAVVDGVLMLQEA